MKQKSHFSSVIRRYGKENKRGEKLSGNLKLLCGISDQTTLKKSFLHQPHKKVQKTASFQTNQQKFIKHLEVSTKCGLALAFS